MIDIPINAEVECVDGAGGRSVCVIVNPASRRLTHVVVAEAEFPHIERLVPVELVEESTPEEIRLRCTQEELKGLDDFVDTEFVQGEYPYAMYNLEEYRLWPYLIPDPAVMPVEHEQVPAGELAVHRGSEVRATDGRVGQVDEFLVDPGSDRITHLVLREGHLWGKKDVPIPLSEIERIEEDTVYLKLDKEGVGALPAVPMRRWHEGHAKELEG
jgi:sporulation protein YlmC with PRC-barrel domain